MTQGNPMLEAARRYTSEGLVIHPLHSPSADVKSPGKQPVLKKWTERGVATEAELQEWFGGESKKFNDCNIGLVVGKRSDRTVLDFDRLDMVPVIFPTGIPKTKMSERKKGRGHSHFKYCNRLPNAKIDLLGVEILNDGANAVLPPSRHKEGQTYAWNDPVAPVASFTEEEIKRLLAICEFPALINKIRPCMQKMIQERQNHNWHEGNGRRRMLALCTDLKRAGGTVLDAHIIAALIYGKEYDRKRTAEEWGNSDPEKTWTCDTLRRGFSEIPPQCQGCSWKEEYKSRNGKQKETGSKQQDQEKAGEIYFVSNPGMQFWKYYEEHPPLTFRIEKNGDSSVYVTDDRAWFKSAEAQEIVERIQPENQFGIRKITIVEGALESDPVIYRMDLTRRDGSAGTIDIEQNLIFDFKHFKNFYAARFQEIIPGMKTEEWEAVLAPLLNNAVRVRDDINEAPIVLQIINMIEGALVVKDKKEFITRGGSTVWLDESTETVWVLSRDIENIVKDYNIDMRRASRLLRHYRKGAGQHHRIEGRHYYLWAFKPGLLQLNLNRAKEVEKDDEVH